VDQFVETESLSQSDFEYLSKSQNPLKIVGSQPVKLIISPPIL
jgi:hypothetical protein